MLKLVKRPKSANWIMRGTVRGVSIEESSGVADRKTAEEILAKRQAEILTESVWGKTATVTFAHAVVDIWNMVRAISAFWNRCSSTSARRCFARSTNTQSTSRPRKFTRTLGRRHAIGRSSRPPRRCCVTPPARGGAPRPRWPARNSRRGLSGG